MSAGREGKPSQAYPRQAQRQKMGPEVGSEHGPESAVRTQDCELIDAMEGRLDISDPLPWIVNMWSRAA